MLALKLHREDSIKTGSSFAKAEPYFSVSLNRERGPSREILPSCMD
jgi:hypothetical protein